MTVETQKHLLNIKDKKTVIPSPSGGLVGWKEHLVHKFASDPSFAGSPHGQRMIAEDKVTTMALKIKELEENVKTLKEERDDFLCSLGEERKRIAMLTEKINNITTSHEEHMVLVEDEFDKEVKLREALEKKAEDDRRLIEELQAANERMKKVDPRDALAALLSPPKIVTNKDVVEKVKKLEEELREANAIIHELRQQQQRQANSDPSIAVPLPPSAL